MEFLPNLIKLPATVSETARLSSVFPRLKVGMVLTALVLESDGEQAVIRMRGMDVNAQSQVPLRPNQQVTLLVSELGREQVVLRVVPEAVPGGMTSLTDMNAEQFEEFNRSVEQCIREEYPSEAWDACANAMALYDRITA